MTDRVPTVSAVIGASTAALALVAACSSTTRLDTSEIEQTLEADYLAVPDAAVGEADCPAELDVSVGDDFECEVEVEGQVLTVVVTVESADGDVSLEQRDEVLVTAELEALVVEELEGGLVGPLEVVCDERSVIVVPPDEELACDVTDASGAAFSVTAAMGPEGIVEVSRP